MNGTIIENGKPRRIRDCFAKYNNPVYIGKVYGRLTVVEALHIGNQWRWRCRCECGNERIVAPMKLFSGHTISCGCARADRMKTYTDIYRRKHGDTGKRLYYILSGMKRRCYNPSDKDYHNYGGRGIRICDEWRNDYSSFKEWALSHGYKDNLTIERIDVNGDYCPENCKWIPHGEQSLNTRANFHVIYHGKDYVFAQLCKEKGIKYYSTYNRINVHGWSVEEAVDYKPLLIGKNHRGGPHPEKAARVK